MYEFLSNPRWINSRQKDKEKEEYGLLCVICCEQPPISPSPSCAPFRLPAAMFIRIRRTRESPPPHTPPHWTILRLQRQIYRTASNQEVMSMTADIGQQR
jgi:hypothetical protein